MCEHLVMKPDFRHLLRKNYRSQIFWMGKTKWFDINMCFLPFHNKSTKCLCSKQCRKIYSVQWIHGFYSWFNSAVTAKLHFSIEYCQ